MSKDPAWDAFLAEQPMSLHPALTRARDYCRRAELRVSGQNHQEIPRKARQIKHVDKILRPTGGFSWRQWGHFMAAVWSKPDDKIYDYLDFYVDR